MKYYNLILYAGAERSQIIELFNQYNLPFRTDTKLDEDFTILLKLRFPICHLVSHEDTR